MKHDYFLNYYLVFLFLQVFHLDAQTWNVGKYTDTETAIYMMTSPFGIDMVTEGQYSQTIYRYNYNGQLVFKFGQKLWTMQPIVNHAGEIITITNRDGCDYEMPAPFVKTIRKINTLGQSATTYTFLSSPYDDYMPLLLLPDSGYIAIADTVLVRFNKSHQFVSRKNIGMGSASWAKVINDRIVISGTTTAGPTLLFLNLNLQPTISFTVPTYFNKGVQITPTLTLLHGINNQLYKLYDTTSISAPFKIDNKFVQDFIVTQDSLVAILYNGLTTNQLAISDLNGNLLWGHTATEPSTNFNRIEFINGQLVHTNTQHASIKPIGFAYVTHPTQVGLNKGTLQTPEPSAADIRLVSLTHDSVYMTLNGYSGTVYTRVKYTVQNNSPFTITNFQIASYASDILPCGHQIVLQKVITNIPPNATQTFTSNWFYLNFPGAPLYPIKSPISFQKCYYLTLPNGFTDTKLSDNESCVNDIATDLTDEHLDIVFKILPNPANNQLHILSEKHIESLVVTDITGKVVMTATPQAESSLLDSSSLPNGIYFVLCKTAYGSSTIKIVIQHR